MPTLIYALNGRRGPLPTLIYALDGRRGPLPTLIYALDGRRGPLPTLIYALDECIGAFPTLVYAFDESIAPFLDGDPPMSCRAVASSPGDPSISRGPVPPPRGIRRRRDENRLLTRCKGTVSAGHRLLTRCKGTSPPKIDSSPDRRRSNDALLAQGLLPLAYAGLIEHYRAVVAWRPDDLHALYYLGGAHVLNGEPDSFAALGFGR